MKNYRLNTSCIFLNTAVSKAILLEGFCKVKPTCLCFPLRMKLTEKNGIKGLMFVFPSICYDLMDRLPYHILPIKASHVYLGVFVPGHARSYTLQNLSPGNYAIFMQANTETGAGETGTMANVHIREDKLK